MCPLCEDGEEEFEEIGQAHVQAHVDSAEDLRQSDVIDADDEVVVQPARPMPQPMVPSAAEVAAHNITHLPYRAWCPHCVSSRRPNSQHRVSSSSSRRMDPLIVADYCFVRDNDDDEPVTLLVARLYPSRSMLATVVKAKGPEQTAVARLAKFIRDSGYAKVIYKSDQEASIRSLFEETFRASAREGVLHNPALLQMVPEASAVGESQSNGRAENAVQKLEDLLRTYKSALETHLQCQIPVKHPIMRWMTEHVASTMNRHLCNSDGQTPYEALHGQRFKGKTVEFGERVFYYVPKKLRSKLTLRWRLGTFVGNAQSTNEAFIAVANGDVVKSRNVVRVVQPSRWNKEAVLGVRGMPHRFRLVDDVQDDAFVEELDDPHANADGPKDEEAMPSSKEVPKISAKDVDRVDIRITMPDLHRYGFSDGCPRCKDLQDKGKSHRHHSDACRLRIYLRLPGIRPPQMASMQTSFRARPSGSKVLQGTGRR